jgi:nucleoside-diphosphate-sugar epimerase
MMNEDEKMNADSTRRVLVAGAGGFIGSHCLPILISNGFEVHAADVFIPEDKLYGVRWHQVDLLDTKQLNELLTTICPTHLLHFAWYAKPGEYWNSLENIRWVEGSLHLLRAFHRNGGKRVVMAGTCAEYDWGAGCCAEDVTPLVPSTLYGTCKNALQHLLKDFSRVTGLSSAWGRIFFLYGPYENPNRLVSSVILNLLQNKTALCSHGNQIRDFLYVEDVASAFVALLESDVMGPVNIASGRPVTLREVVLTAADYLGARERVQFGAIPAPENDPPLIVGDSHRLADEVGWHPEYNLATGIAQTVRYWRERKDA